MSIHNCPFCECLIRAANEAQKEEMRKHKWIESEKAGFDIGPIAYLDWVRNYASQWRESFMDKNSDFDCTCKQREPFQ